MASGEQESVACAGAPVARSSHWYWVVRVSVFLVLGMAMNIGVAWGLLLSMQEMPSITVDRLNTRHAGQGPMPAWPWYLPNDWPDMHRQSIVRQQRFDIVLRSWNENTRFDEDGGINQVISFPARSASAHAIRAGWPMRSLFFTSASETESTMLDGNLKQTSRWSLEQDDGILSPVLRGIETPSWILDRRQGKVFERIPIAPIATGFAVNTILYSLMLACPWLLWACIRRNRYARGGRCVRCGYDITGVDVCPECGTPVDPCHKPAR